MSRPTAADVARRAGVSRATVSYVLNRVDTQSISAATTEAVQKAARELGYVPNAFAQSLKRGQGSTVLVPFSVSLMGPPLAQAFEACAAALSRRGLTLVTDSVQYASRSERAEAWMRLHPAAVIEAFAPPDDALARQLRRAGIALVAGGGTEGLTAAQAFARDARRTQLDYATDRYGTVLVAGPLLDDGGPPVPRRRGVTVKRAPLDAAGVSAVAEHCARIRPAAVGAFNDDFAIALITALVGRRLRVPEDIAVIGIDDIPLAAATTPALTTVAGDFDAWGEALVEVVQEALRSPARKHALPPLRSHVVVRTSG